MMIRNYKERIRGILKQRHDNEEIKPYINYTSIYYALIIHYTP